jgi:hypothetical protein
MTARDGDADLHERLYRCTGQPPYSRSSRPLLFFDRDTPASLRAAIPIVPRGFGCVVDRPCPPVYRFTSAMLL